MVGNCSESSGSGVIVNKSGIILTAQHVVVVPSVVVPSKEEYLNSFEIEMLGDLNAAPQAHYQARLLADIIIDENGKPNRDIAFLQIITDTTTSTHVTSQQLENLVVLPVNTSSLKSSDQSLLLIGYPKDQAIYCQWHAIRKIEKDEIQLQSSNLDKTCLYSVTDHSRMLGNDMYGASGGPALQEQEGRLAVVGIIKGPGIIVDSGVVTSSIRVQSLSSLTQIRWLPQAGLGNTRTSPIWAENGKIEKIIDPNNGKPLLRITLDLYAINFVDQKLQLLTYAFDQVGVPITGTAPLPLTPLKKQLVLYHNNNDMNAKQFVDKLQIIETFPFTVVNNLGISPDQIKFRLLVWDTQKEALLWEGERWYSIEEPIIIIPTPTFTPSPTLVPPPTIKDELVLAPIATDTPTPTHTPMPLPTLTGRIAYPVQKSGHIDIHVYCIEQGEECRVLDHMSQPDFDGGGYLLVNGNGNGWDAIVRMNPHYENWNPASLHPEDLHPRWSPGGDRLIFDSRFEGPDHQDYIYEQENPNRKPNEDPFALQYNEGKLPGNHPVYLPGYDIAYQGCDNWNAGSLCGIYVTRDRNPIEQKPIRRTDSTNDLPTDNLAGQVLFMSNRAGNWEVYTVGAPFDIRNITNSPDTCDGLATASPDGNYIAFLSQRDGIWSIYVVRSDGTDLHKLYDIGDIGFGCGDSIWREEYMSWGVGAN